MSDPCPPKTPATKEERDELFKELLVGYTASVRKLEQFDGEDDFPEHIDMSKPIPSYYSKREKKGQPQKHVRLGEDVNTKLSRSDSSVPDTPFRELDTENCAITLRQLIGIMENVKRRCVEEGWTRAVYGPNGRTGEYTRIRSPEEVNLYDIDKYVIGPFTDATQKSLVESLPTTAGAQPPRWFVSHWWGEQFQDTLACIRTMQFDFARNDRSSFDERGGGMTLDTPIWICAFANNQHELADAVTNNPADSSFAKAMAIAKHRVISIVDEKQTMFTRIWCVFELFLTLVQSGGDNKDGDRKSLWATYTAHKHDGRSAVGIVNGGVPRDIERGDLTGIRESAFPTERIFNALKVDIVTANASWKQDKINILNYVADRFDDDDLTKEPLAEHENYTLLNNAVRGAFASSIPAIVAAHTYQDGALWKDTLVALSKSSSTEELTFDFNDGGSWDDGFLNDTNAAIELIAHLPKSLKEFHIEHAPFGKPLIDAIIDFINSDGVALEKLTIANICVGGLVGGKDSGLGLANAIASNSNGYGSLKELELFCTDLIGGRNIMEWTQALKGNSSITSVKVYGLGGREADESSFDKATSTIGLVCDARMRVFHARDGNPKFPDAMMDKGQEMDFKEALSAENKDVIVQWMD
mmetsp:Transcript_4057/g.5883  ORF Transcript_4057/g.5883 Transcript_4057/m.5883 type:complete len:641 (-) Transcript_4057:88-2010(-)|eukprot:CAMPEP_0203661952 /NCGR_PEP_ID=MMETSP0090-20130426/42_1 /ASSEMBLY_ACC=CAM_ASM_001088 /TAXON_ID=426623 /ORGANISM="Chaetoceros affinis, Strain CCMP159" /LENGTH=640 /DNA_ID=CAMNT_0050524665 /DNA_START=74 /DNA_END=1996 /DNA_ORIENTATION=-